jgi:hypothetical protein
MTTLPTPSLLPLATVLVAALLAACDSGPSQAEYLAVCLKGRADRVNQALSLQMGVDRDSYCKCAAKQVQSAVSSEGRRWMMLNMQNKKQEARALQAKLSDKEQEDLMKAGLEVFGKFAPGAR